MYACNAKTQAVAAVLQPLVLQLCIYRLLEFVAAVLQLCVYRLLEFVAAVLQLCTYRLLEFVAAVLQLCIYRLLEFVAAVLLLQLCCSTCVADTLPFKPHHMYARITFQTLPIYGHITLNNDVCTHCPQ